MCDNLNINRNVKFEKFRIPDKTFTETYIVSKLTSYKVKYMGYDLTH